VFNQFTNHLLFTLFVTLDTFKFTFYIFVLTLDAEIQITKKELIIAFLNFHLILNSFLALLEAFFMYLDQIINSFLGFGKASREMSARKAKRCLINA
jgi:hypothetical protein